MDSQILTTLFQIAPWLRAPGSVSIALTRSDQVWLLLCLSSVIWNSSNVVLQYVTLPAELHSFFFYDAGLAFGAFLCLWLGDLLGVFTYRGIRLCGGCLRRATNAPWTLFACVAWGKLAWHMYK